MDSFRRTYFRALDYKQRKWEPMPGSADAIYAKLKPFSFRIDIDDLVTRPGSTDVRVEVDLPPAARKFYREIERDLVAFLDADELDVVEAASAAALSNKLVQVTAGFVYQMDAFGAQTTHHMHNAKYDALAGLLDEIGDRPTIVVYWYKEQLRELRARFNAETLDDPDALQRWTDGEVSLLALQPRSAGEGLNLHLSGCRNMVFLTRPWGGEEQVRGRIDRRGQEHHVVFHSVEVKDSIDQHIATVVDKKHRGNKALLDAMREHTRNRYA
jgi:hypothetical protein